MGMVTPVGLNVSESWENILAGKSGIKPIEHMDTELFSVKFGGSVRNFNINDYLSPKESKKMDTFMHYGMAAGIQAIED